MKLHNLINAYYQFRELVEPSAEDALLFLLSEIGELCEAYVSHKHNDLSAPTLSILMDMQYVGNRADEYVSNRNNWIRNNDRAKDPNIEFEIADVQMMLERFAARLNMDPIRALICKMKSKGFDTPAPNTE